MSRRLREGSEYRPLPRHLISDALWSVNNLSVTEKAVGEVLARCFGDHDHAFPGRAYLAQRAGLDVRTVTRALKVLVNGAAARGIPPLFTRQVRRRADGRPCGFTYRRISDPEALVAGRQSHAACDTEAPEAGDVLHDLQPDPPSSTPITEPPEPIIDAAPSAARQDREAIYREKIEELRRALHQPRGARLAKTGSEG